MLKKSIFAVLLIANTSLCLAGTVTGGAWKPNGCGPEPAAPVLKLDSEDAYNNSVKEVNDWQQKAQSYNNCLIKEANVDNDVITKSANAQQNRFKSIADKIKTDFTAAKAKLGG